MPIRDRPPWGLKDYWRQVTRQSIGGAGVTPDDIQRALKGLVLSAEILEHVGVAAVSGKPLFLYGPAGNGKTVISQCLGGIWQDDILVPYAIYVDGQVIQVFDEITHARSGGGLGRGESGPPLGAVPPAIGDGGGRTHPGHAGPGL